MDLDLLRRSSPFPRAVELCLQGMVYNVRDTLFVVRPRPRHHALTAQRPKGHVEMLHLQLNPRNWSFIREVREACRLLRNTGAEWIQKRKTAMENGEVPKDILTQIIKAAGKGERHSCFIAFIVGRRVCKEVS